MARLEGQKTERVNIRISTEIKEWFDNMAIETGISRSSLMAMALREYIDQKKGLKLMNDIPSLLASINKIK